MSKKNLIVMWLAILISVFVLLFYILITAGSGHISKDSLWTLVFILAFVWLIATGIFMTPTNALAIPFKVFLLSLPVTSLLLGMAIMNDARIFNDGIILFLGIGVILIALNVIRYCRIPSDRRTTKRCFIGSIITIFAIGVLFFGILIWDDNSSGMSVGMFDDLVEQFEEKPKPSKHRRPSLY